MSVLSYSRRLAVAALVLLHQAAPAQIRTIDPSSPTVAASAAPAGSGEAPPPEYRTPPPPAPAPSASSATTAATDPAAASQADATAYKDEEIFGAAEEVFGKGAKDLAKVIENVLKKQGRPTAYIAGREAGGAFAIGLRYGQGDLFHKIEGTKQVWWTGPSLGFDIGGNGSKTFILVYNLYDSEELFKRFPLVEGNLYAIGGFTASYLRRGDVVLVPIRLGVGWRFGASVGYMKFTKEGKVMPF
jgi:hypothetical protein